MNTITTAEIENKRAELMAPGAMFELRNVILEGQSYRAFKNAHSSLIGVLQAARDHGDAEYLVYYEERYTYRDFFAKTDALAASLQHDHGVSAGDRVAIAMRNCPEWTFAFCAALLLGAIPVPINSWGKTEELEYAITDCGAKLLVCDEQRARLIEQSQQLMSCTVVVARVNAPISADIQFHRFEGLVDQGYGREYDIASPNPEATSMILYTSGSTGMPKGVMIRHIAVCQALMNMMFSGMLVMSLDGEAELRGGATQDTTLATVPLFHGTGLMGSLLIPLLTGNKTVMMYKWDALKALELIQREKITTFGTVPTVLQDLLNHPEFDNYNTASVLRLGAGGAASPAGLPELIERKIPQPVMSMGWGMTETIAVGAFMSGSLCHLARESAGLPSPLVDLRFVDGEQTPLPPGEIGEIEVRSVCCTPGYWGNPDATAKIFSDNRWMKTGDLGRLDENGYLHITGRIKEIVIRGGENIFPGEIEKVVYTLDGVHEVAVFGVPDEAMGEELAMTLYLKPGSELDEATVHAALKNRLATYKVPRYIEFSAEPLPQNASGKLHRMKVRQAYLEKL